MRTCCPSCDSFAFKKNGINQHGDQNHKCLDCSRQFVLDPHNKIISEETKTLIRRLLLEKLSLRGICRAAEVSLPWLLDFVKQEYAGVPHDLNVQVPPESTGLILERIEADERWSFAGSKKNQVWIWLALDALTRQVIALHADGRYQSGCDVYTDEWRAYQGAIPPEVHFAVKKKSGKTILIEGVNYILRQRICRLVRKTDSFSKKLTNHLGAIRYFLSHYNLWAYQAFREKFQLIDCLIL